MSGLAINSRRFRECNFTWSKQKIIRRMFIHLFFVFYNLLVTEDYFQFYTFVSCYLCGASRCEFDVVNLFIFSGLWEFPEQRLIIEPIWWEFGKRRLWRRNCKSTYRTVAPSVKTTHYFLALRVISINFPFVISMLYITH